MLVIGVDVGLGGAIACLGHRGEFLGAEDMPTVERTGKSRAIDAVGLRALLSRFTSGHESAAVMVIVEQVSARPGQGVVSMFSFGHSLGVVEGVVCAMRLPHELVTPQRWKREAGISKDSKTKEQARSIATKFYPDAELVLVKDGGKAEALLIARYGTRKYA